MQQPQHYRKQYNYTKSIHGNKWTECTDKLTLNMPQMIVLLIAIFVACVDITQLTRTTLCMRQDIKNQRQNYTPRHLSKLWKLSISIHYITRGWRFAKKTVNLCNCTFNGFRLKWCTEFRKTLSLNVESNRDAHINMKIKHVVWNAATRILHDTWTSNHRHITTVISALQRSAGRQLTEMFGHSYALKICACYIEKEWIV